MVEPDVVLVGPYPAIGVRQSVVSGVAPYTRHLALNLCKKGINVRVVAPREREDEAFERDEAVLIERPFRRGPAAAPLALRAAQAIAAPVIHLQHELFLYGGIGSIPALLPSLLWSRRARRCVVTMHQVIAPNQVDRDFTRLHRVRIPAPLARACLDCVQRGVPRVCDRVIVHETGFASLVPNSVVVPHGIETVSASDRSAARAELGLDARFVVLCFGFVAPYKGLEVALAGGRKAGVHMAVVGGVHPRLPDGGAYLGSLRSRWPEAQFTGHVSEEDVPKWFSASDVALFLYPKPHATSGGLHVALAHGTPFLLSEALARCTGAPAGTEVPAAEAAIARRLELLARDPRALERLRQGCKEMARGRAWTTVAQRHADIYQEVVDARGAGGR